jgi:hypothetical protein
MSPFPLKKLFPSAPDFTAFSIKPNNKTLSPHGLNREEKPFHLQQTHVHVFRLIGTDRVLLSQPIRKGHAVAIGVPDTRISSPGRAPMRGGRIGGFGLADMAAFWGVELM